MSWRRPARELGPDPYTTGSDLYAGPEGRLVEVERDPLDPGFLRDERGSVKVREVLEAVSWRLTSDVLLLLCTWVITGRPTQAIGVTVLYSVVSIVWYVPHNRWWRGRRGRRVAAGLARWRRQ